METIIYLAAAIEVILMILFFSMCYDVKEMKNEMIPHENFQAMFLLYCSSGEKEKAKNLLFKEIASENMFVDAFFSNLPEHEKAKQTILMKYDKLLKMVDVTLDFDIVDKYLKE